MKSSKEFLMENNLLPLKTYDVQSRSEKGLIHKVEYFGDGSLSCDCIAGCFKAPCYHKKLISEALQKQGVYTKSGISSLSK